MQPQNLCPYCRSNSANSGDHIFPDFLGGIRKIRACTQCNNKTFGAGFEKAVASNLVPLFVSLSLAGYEHPRKKVFEKAWTDPQTGIEYDLDARGYLTARKPHFILENGIISGVAAPTKEIARQFAAQLKNTGTKRSERLGFAVRSTAAASGFDFELAVGPELKKLALKMCVALGQSLIPSARIIDDQRRQCLIGTTVPGNWISLIFNSIEKLDALRPPLAHTIYIEGNPIERKCYGVVQFFGKVAQLHVLLNETYDGPKFSELGILDIKTFSERFLTVNPLSLDKSPEIFNNNGIEECFDVLEININNEVNAAFGKESLLALSPTQKLRDLEITLPLLWIEHVPQISFQIEFASSEESPAGSRFSDDPNKWLFSSNFGESHIPLIDDFFKKWNAGSLERVIGKTHLYFPTIPASGLHLQLGNDYWRSIESICIEYKVAQQAWLGSVHLPMPTATSNRKNHSISGNVLLSADRIPRKRETSWIPVPDPAKYKSEIQDLVTVDIWDIDHSSITVGRCEFS